MSIKQNIVSVLKTIPDPELGISIWDLGLVYGISADKKGNVIITMTLTSVGCPLFSIIEKDILEKVSKLKGVKKAGIDLTFEPPWNADRMTKKARDQMGL